jgi:hypothetical protein
MPDSTLVTRRLKRIAPLKFGLILGIMYGLMSLLIIPFMLLSVVFALLAPAHQENAGLPAGIGAALGIVLAIFIPVLYAVLGGLLGMLMAWVYNVIASWVGGIEFEVE